jgi:hypothetical protein
MLDIHSDAPAQPPDSGAEDDPWDEAHKPPKVQPPDGPALDKTTPADSGPDKASLASQP